MIDWNKLKIYDAKIVTAIVKRAVITEVDREVMNLKMDIEAAHISGNPMDLKKLLSAPVGDFLHDVCGIIKNLNRETGKLENCFVPRCSR